MSETRRACQRRPRRRRQGARPLRSRSGPAAPGAGRAGGGGGRTPRPRRRKTPAAAFGAGSASGRLCRRRRARAVTGGPSGSAPWQSRGRGPAPGRATRLSDPAGSRKGRRPGSGGAGRPGRAGRSRHVGRREGSLPERPTAAPRLCVTLSAPFAPSRPGPLESGSRSAGRERGLGP